MKLLLRAALNVAIIWFTFRLVEGISFSGDWTTLVIIVVLLAFANAFVSPTLKLLALPVRLLTLGLATLAIDVAVVASVIWLAEKLDLGVTSTGWSATLLGALVIATLSAAVSLVVKD